MGARLGSFPHILFGTNMDNMNFEYDKWLSDQFEENSCPYEGETLIFDLIRDFDIQPEFFYNHDERAHCHWCNDKKAQLYRLNPINDMLCCKPCSLLNYL